MLHQRKPRFDLEIYTSTNYKSPQDMLTDLLSQINHQQNSSNICFTEKEVREDTKILNLSSYELNNYEEIIILKGLEFMTNTTEGRRRKL